MTTVPLMSTRWCSRKPDCFDSSTETDCSTAAPTGFSQHHHMGLHQLTNMDSLPVSRTHLLYLVLPMNVWTASSAVISLSGLRSPSRLPEGRQSGSFCVDGLRFLTMFVPQSWKQWLNWAEVSPCNVSFGSRLCQLEKVRGKPCRHLYIQHFYFTTRTK